MWIFLGYNNRREYRLSYLENGKTRHFFYDFTLPQYKIIFEYNGEKWHPNKQILSTTEWKNWRMPIDNLTAEQKLCYDQKKKKTAQEHGFEVFEIWPSFGQKYNWDIITNVLYEKGIII